MSLTTNTTTLQSILAKAQALPDKTQTTVPHNAPTLTFNDSTGLFTATHEQTSGLVNMDTKNSDTITLTAAQSQYTPTRASQVINSHLYANSTVTVKGDSNLRPENIKKGVTIFGVTGTYVPFSGPDYLCFTANTAGSTVSMALNGSTTITVSLEYSTDGTNWQTFTAGTTTVTLANMGDRVYFKGNNTGFGSVTKSYCSFVLTGSISASGSIISILDETCQSTTLTIDAYCFYKLFENCSVLTSAPKLLAASVSIPDYCYQYMFQGCISLTTAPALPATTLSGYCYSHMFDGCTSLTTAPALPATSLNTRCYEAMFYGCTSLTTVPDLPANAQVEQNCCENMFEGCTSLTIAPALPTTTTLGSNCYNCMFKNCISLNTLPNLQAKILLTLCYYRMFYGCTNIKVSETQVGEYQYPWRIPTSGTGTEADNWNVDMLLDTGGTFTSDPSINTTYYTNHQPV